MAFSNTSVDIARAVKLSACMQTEKPEVRRRPLSSTHHAFVFAASSVCKWLGAEDVELTGRGRLFAIATRSYSSQGSDGSINSRLEQVRLGSTRPSHGQISTVVASTRAMFQWWWEQ
jgi:hypothetical protein